MTYSKTTVFSIMGQGIPTMYGALGCAWCRWIPSALLMLWGPLSPHILVYVKAGRSLRLPCYTTL